MQNKQLGKTTDDECQNKSWVILLTRQMMKSTL